MNTHERFSAVLNFERPDRLPIIEWAGWWNETVKRWQSEGLPVSGQHEIMKYFGLDIHYQEWYIPMSADAPQPKGHGAGLIQNIDDYMKFKEYLYPSNMDLEIWRRRKLEQDAGKAALWFSLEGFFWFPRRLLGIERHLYAFFDQPELLHRINDELVEYNIGIVRKICSICRPNFMTFAEDMSYNNGPMLSEEHFNEFIKPYYLKIVPVLREYGVKIIIDSDGCIHKLARWFDGIADGFLPLEKQAGTDISLLRREHPKQIYIGAFDKMCMDKGESAMRAEFERLLPVAGQGGFVISCDHQTPPAVSIEDYKLYVRLFNEYSRKI